MARTLVKNLKARAEEEVTVSGWVNSVRNQRQVQFLILRDFTGLVQVVNRRADNPRLAEIIESLTDESAVSVTGKVVLNDKVNLNQLEIVATEVRAESIAATPIPIAPDTNLDQRLDWRFLDLRRPTARLTMEIQTTIEQAMRDYWRDEGFIEIHSPKLMATPSESGAELFHVEYFDGDAYLAQSPQFYKQMAMAAGLERVFEIGPVFRANPSFTARHDTEFTSVDLEMSWVNSHEDVMVFEENWLEAVLEAVKGRHGRQIREMFGVDVVIPQLPFPRITMEEAHRIVAQAGHILPPEGKGDLDPQGERLVAAHVQERFGHEFAFVTEYPTSVRPFYHMRMEGDPSKTKSFDLLWKGLEITTGAQREHRYDVLLSQVIEKGLTPETISYYLDFFRFGCPPHGGLGFGLTRMIMVLLGISNVREVTYVYRGPTRLTP